MYREGQLVYKPEGFTYRGTVLAVVRTLGGELRYIVEADRAPGMLTAFRASDLRLQPIEKLCGECRHSWKNHERRLVTSNGEHEVGVCFGYMGMGDVCGCEERVPDSVHLEQGRV